MIQGLIVYCKKYQEIINYLIFGILTTVINLLTYYSLTFTILNPNKILCLQAANIISWIVSVMFAYITNRKYVFKSNNENIAREFLKFTEARIITLILDMAIMYLGVSIARFNDKIIKIVSQILVIISNYVLSKIFIFKNNKKL